MESLNTYTGCASSVVITGDFVFTCVFLFFILKKNENKDQFKFVFILMFAVAQ